jgi:cell division protease FtsH
MLSRPIILNIWGNVTGVGKTDLIRTLVKELNYADKYMDSVYEIMQSKDFSSEEPNIILFDEIQKFRTLDQDRNEIRDMKYQDFRELLSDGKINPKSDYYDFNRILYKVYENRTIKEVKSTTGKQGKKTFNLEIVKLNWEELEKELNKKIKTKQVYQYLDFSKTLIIISGNLDDAYQMAGEAAEVEIDANIYRSFTEKIGVVNIKEALSKRFKPEQISRLENSHLIYRSLSKKDYQQIIAKNISKYQQNCKNCLGIALKVNSSMAELIYDNGVSPVQGV